MSTFENSILVCLVVSAVSLAFIAKVLISIRGAIVHHHQFQSRALADRGKQGLQYAREIGPGVVQGHDDTERLHLRRCPATLRSAARPFR